MPSQTSSISYICNNILYIVKDEHKTTNIQKAHPIIAWSTFSINVVDYATYGKFTREKSATYK